MREESESGILSVGNEEGKRKWEYRLSNSIHLEKVYTDLNLVKSVRG